MTDAELQAMVDAMATKVREYETSQATAESLRTEALAAANTVIAAVNEIAVRLQ